MKKGLAETVSTVKHKQNQVEITRLLSAQNLKEATGENPEKSLKASLGLTISAQQSQWNWSQACFGDVCFGESGCGGHLLRVELWSPPAHTPLIES